MLNLWEYLETNTIRTIFAVRIVLNMRPDKIIKTTLLDYAILGLLQDQLLSGYRIRKVFEETALGNYSSSPGSIYPALKRLQRFDLIVSIVDKTTTKTQFKITKKGIQILTVWLSKPIEKQEVKKRIYELFLRFGFMSKLADNEQKIKFLTSFRDLLGEYLNELLEFHKDVGSDMPLHGRLAFEFGIESYKTSLKWCKKALLQIKKIDES